VRGWVSKFSDWPGSCISTLRATRRISRYASYVMHTSLVGDHPTKGLRTLLMVWHGPCIGTDCAWCTKTHSVEARNTQLHKSCHALRVYENVHVQKWTVQKCTTCLVPRGPGLANTRYVPRRDLYHNVQWCVQKRTQCNKNAHIDK
jgi:hypothetical protein